MHRVGHIKRGHGLIVLSEVFNVELLFSLFTKYRKYNLWPNNGNMLLVFTCCPWSHLTYLQVFHMLKKSDPELLKRFVSRRELLFLSCLPVTPNCHRVVEIGYGLSDGRLTFVSCMLFFVLKSIFYSSSFQFMISTLLFMFECYFSI
jgi:hypothetical protein